MKRAGRRVHSSIMKGVSVRSNAAPEKRLSPRGRSTHTVMV